jgi:hypothetical protein
LAGSDFRSPLARAACRRFAFERLSQRRGGAAITPG